MTEMRRLIQLVETAGRAGRRTAKPPESVAYEIKRYDGPNNEASKVVDRIVLYAATKDELHSKIRAWMDQIGLDPDDEDDLNTLDWARVE